jgi:AraC family transcriptional regulator
MPGIIQDESSWRRPAALMEGTSAPMRVIASRWAEASEHARHVTATIHARYHTIAIALRRAKIALRVSDRVVYDGIANPGTIQVSGPGTIVDAILGSPCDFLHIHVPHWLLLECYTAAHGFASGSRISLVDPCFRHDTTIDQLVRALLSADSTPSSSGQHYTDGIGVAIITRLLDAHSNVSEVCAKQRVLRLPNWRLERATEFIEVHLCESVTLADIAGAAGISPMHFAAQFRATTGLRPHEYVLRRRVDRAKSMLSQPELPIADVALTVGFKNQAHFTTVFRRFAGDTPNQWRQAHCT